MSKLNEAGDIEDAKQATDQILHKQTGRRRAAIESDAKNKFAGLFALLRAFTLLAAFAHQLNQIGVLLRLDGSWDHAELLRLCCEEIESKWEKWSALCPKATSTHLTTLRNGGAAGPLSDIILPALMGIFHVRGASLPC